jgi:hypothetical protein
MLPSTIYVTSKGVSVHIVEYILIRGMMGCGADDPSSFVQFFVLRCGAELSGVQGRRTTFALTLGPIMLLRNARSLRLEACTEGTL